jgi:hypothetical protein
MFIKLKNRFNFENYETQDNRVSYGRTLGDTFYGIAYDYLKTKSNHGLFEVIPEQHRDKFALLLMKINSNIAPHTDSKILATINFYVKAEEATTTFYSIVSSNPETRQIKNQTNGRIFQLSDLVPFDSFVAEDNEAYLLDVTNPHSVMYKKTPQNRIAFVLQTPHFSYEEVCSMLEKTGNL